MNTNLISFSNYAVTFIKEIVLPIVTARQKKILTIVSAALFSLTACYALGRYCLPLIGRLVKQSKKVNSQSDVNYSIKNLFKDPHHIDNLPVITTDKVSNSDYPTIRENDMSSAIMKGEDINGREFLAFKIQLTIPSSVYQGRYRQELVDAMQKDADKNIIDSRVLVLFQRHIDQPKIWEKSFQAFLLPSDPFYMININFDTGPRDIDKESFQRLQTLIETGRLEYEGCLLEL